jgi:hypothetical protein
MYNDDIDSPPICDPAKIILQSSFFMLQSPISEIGINFRVWPLDHTILLIKINICFNIKSSQVFYFPSVKRRLTDTALLCKLGAVKSNS